MNVGKRQAKALELKRGSQPGSFTAVRRRGEWQVFERDLVILVHGFNNDQESAQEVYDKLLGQYRRGGVPEYYMRRVVPFFWPAYRAWWIRGASYHVMVGDTLNAAVRLADFLRNYFAVNRNAQVTFVAHSLGCRLVLEALVNLVTTNPANRPNIKHTCLMAAAVPVGAVSQPAGRLNSLLSSNLHISGIASTGDWTLATLFRLGSWLSVDGAASPAVGYAGLPKQLWTDRCEHLQIGHRQYWSNPQVAQIVANKMTMPVARILGTRNLSVHEPITQRRAGRKIGR